MLVFQDCKEDPVKKGLEFYAKFDDSKEGAWVTRQRKKLDKAKEFAMDVMKAVEYAPNNQQMAVALSIFCSM